jgi:pimeloyl-ACP methyl ester carboxylesterase
VSHDADDGGKAATYARVKSPVEITESSALLGGVRTRTLAVAGEGAPILLLHGFSDSADTWRPVLAELGEIGRHAVAVDMPGSGRADPIPRRRPLDALDAFTKAFVLANANDSPVVLAGNSLGGLVALRAARGPELPLLAVAPISPGGLAHHRQLELFERGVRGLAPLLWVLSQIPVPGRLVTLYAQQVYDRRLRGGRTDPSLMRYYASHYTGMGDIRRVGGDLLALVDANRADPLVLDGIRVPVLLIWGGRDRLADVAGAQLVLDAVAASRLVVFEDCGHCAQVERPADVARLLAALPASAERSAGETATLRPLTDDALP